MTMSWQWSDAIDLGSLQMRHKIFVSSPFVSDIGSVCHREHQPKICETVGDIIMVSWQTTITALLALLVLSGFSSVETKKRKKGKHLFQGETLQEMCQSARQDSLKRNILELQAFFDLDKVVNVRKLKLFTVDTKDFYYIYTDISL